jgi:glutamate-ammonia-ligase adenylyltransferase
MDELPVINDVVLAGQLQRVISASRFARQLCQRQPELLAELLDSGDLTRSYGDRTVSEALRLRLAGCDSRVELARRLRRFRQREILRVLWRDFNRSADTLETTGDMSLLAECCIAQALDWLHEELARQYGEPRDTAGRVQQLLVIAMGKLGARELNLSSDIDLIFTYPESGQTDGEQRALDNQEFFIKLGQRLIAALDQTTAEGFVFRVDMRLRPYGQSGALVLNFSALEEYYQDQGRDWERYALIKARVITGPQWQRDSLSESLRPFVFRRYIDFGVIESLRDMKEMINTEVRRRGLREDVKLGPGGIREVEFIAQCFQLIRGGRCQSLQQRELLPVLDACREEGCLPAEAVTELKRAYLFLRDTEHAIQGYDDKQTQSLPGSEEAQQALLVALDFPNWEAFSQTLDEHRARVSSHFANLIAVPAEKQSDEPTPVWPDGLNEHALQALGFADGAGVAQALCELRDGSRLRYLQAESRARLDRFMPRLLSTCAAHEQADAVLMRLLPLVQSVLRRSAYLMLLLENPMALRELVTLCAASPWISEQLARQPVLLDELLDTRSLYSAPDRDVLQQELSQQVLRIPWDDLEGQMEALRYFKASQMLHVAASEVSGRLPLMKVSDKLSFLAEVILEHALAVAWHDLTGKYGTPGREGEGSGFIIVGYGKLGGIELGHGSDLDLVFIYDAAVGGSTDGERALDNAVFYTRLGQRIIHILDSRTALGQLYEVDMRLRPSGESGMLVTSYSGYRDYQMNSAWTWEHQALVRGRFIAGDPELGRRFAALREEVLSQPRQEAALRQEVVGMREKMREHLLPAETVRNGMFHLKQGQGGIVDIEFMVQYAVLAWSHRVPGLAFWSDNVRILEALQQAGFLTAAESLALTEAYLAYRSAVHQLSLQQRPGEVEAERFEQERAAVTAKWNDLLGAEL